MTAQSTQSTSRQRFTGVVVSDKMTKTVVVKLENKKRHPKYHKSYTVTKRVQAHDELGSKVGQKVTIEATKPISKNKHFKVVA